MNTSTNNKHQSTHSSKRERDKQSQPSNLQIEESKTVEPISQVEKEFHGPSNSIFILSQKISKKESLILNIFLF